MNYRKKLAIAAIAILLSLGGIRLVMAQGKTLIIYSGRNENLIGPVIDKARQELGLNIEVRYGDTAELAIALLEEGRNSRADLFFSQDAGALGAMAQARRTMPIPQPLLNKVDQRFRSRNGQWIGISGRARVVDYNTQLVQPNELPSNIWELTDPKWRGKVGWAPTNGSFQSFVTAMRSIAGDARTLEWLRGMKDNGAVVYRNNTTIVEALGRGEVHLGLVNNYYLSRFTSENPNFPVAHHYMPGDVGSMINVAGIAIMDTTDQKGDTEKFIEYLLKPEAQQYFAQETTEYPLVSGVQPPAKQISISQINPPNIDLSNLADLEGTISLLEQAGLL
ncbi:iron ABC transporter substrate-binding protein [Phormidium pseudopriestleyi FRX01]|uniref:Iron ABC transporter substrate-binding protein n=1 Tax=Phormidium pseudopriestleyi FRX01 TaxID=1759528 RepID=A0ABS3FT49_9CYAN|nr:iron ABC transporter substrate-binding protein [Phormidium pseudopriestleyi]MBO0350233.1 iron ABC transporter substrate-binding protein [Phormidium pseudopriestleyi FRX01]